MGKYLERLVEKEDINSIINEIHIIQKEINDAVKMLQVPIWNSIVKRNIDLLEKELDLSKKSLDIVMKIRNNFYTTLKN